MTSINYRPMNSYNIWCFEGFHHAFSHNDVKMLQGEGDYQLAHRIAALVELNYDGFSPVRKSLYEWGFTSDHCTLNSVVRVMGALNELGWSAKKHGDESGWHTTYLEIVGTGLTNRRFLEFRLPEMLRKVNAALVVTYVPGRRTAQIDFDFVGLDPKDLTMINEIIHQYAHEQGAAKGSWYVQVEKQDRGYQNVKDVLVFTPKPK